MSTFAIPKPVEVRPGVLAFSVTLNYNDERREGSAATGYKWTQIPMTADVILEIDVADAILSIGGRAARNKGRRSQDGHITAKATNVRARQ